MRIKERIIQIIIGSFILFSILILAILSILLFILLLPLMALGIILWQIIKLILSILFILSGIGLYFLILAGIYQFYPNPIIVQIVIGSAMVITFMVISPIILAIFSGDYRRRL